MADMGAYTSGSRKRLWGCKAQQVLGPQGPGQAHTAIGLQAVSSSTPAGSSLRSASPVPLLIYAAPSARSTFPVFAQVPLTTPSRH